MATQTFDPFHQTFSILLGDGTPLNITMDELNDNVQFSVQICINYASQLGASLMLFIVLLLLTKPEKRLSPVFFLNTSALFINVCRMFCLLAYWTSAWSNQYAYFAQDFSRVPRADYATSVASVVLTFLLLIFVEISLVLQTQVVFTTLREIHRRLLLAVSIFVASVAIGFRFAMVIKLSEYIVAAKNFTPYVWLQSATNIAITVSICFFCLIFAVKLGFAIQQRRALGLKQFGPMQIIFIMGCQTMVVPGKTNTSRYLSTTCSQFLSHILHSSIPHQCT
jgi:pheromone alpha factor receptor